MSLPAPSKTAPKQRLVDAMAAAIAEFETAEAWSADTIEQVRTAIRLLDYAAGGNVFVEDVTQAHISAFAELCKKLPNRWGRTREEKAGGLAASLERAKGMPKTMLGMGQATIAKHITWITQVLSHADDEGSVLGHRPVERLTWTKTRRGVGKGTVDVTIGRWGPAQIFWNAVPFRDADGGLWLVPPPDQASRSLHVGTAGLVPTGRPPYRDTDERMEGVGRAARETVLALRRSRRS